MIVRDQKQRVIWLAVLAVVLIVLHDMAGSHPDLPTWAAAILKLYDITVTAIFTAILINFIVNYQSNQSEEDKLAEEVGYGRLMQIASEQWSEKATNNGRPGEGFVLGPHAGKTIDCGCEASEHCEWCCGAGWVTEKVKQSKICQSIKKDGKGLFHE